MTSDLMTLRDLRVQTFKERKEGRLTKLPDNFYRKLGNLEEQIRKMVESVDTDGNECIDVDEVL